MQAENKKLNMTEGHSSAQDATRSNVTSDARSAQSTCSEKVTGSCLENEPFTRVSREPLEQDVPQYTDFDRKTGSPSPPDKEDKVYVHVYVWSIALHCFKSSYNSFVQLAIMFSFCTLHVGVNIKFLYPTHATCTCSYMYVP